MLGTGGKDVMTHHEAGGPAYPGSRSVRSGVFDPNVLEAAGVDDPVLVEEVLITFFVASTDLLREMFHQQRVGDTTGLAGGAARLAELAEAVGARRLEERCGTLIAAGGGPRPEREVDELFLLDRELDRAQAAMRLYLQGWMP